MGVVGADITGSGFHIHMNVAQLKRLPRGLEAEERQAVSTFI